jgi:hypothetical protein
MNDPNYPPAVLLQFPAGPVVEGHIPDQPLNDLPIFLRVAVKNARRLKCCFTAEFCVFFLFGLNNVYLMSLPWIGIVGWFGVNHFQPRTLAAVAVIHIVLTLSGSLCLGLQISSGNSYGVCTLAFDIPASDRLFAHTVLVLLVLFALSAIASLSWKLRVYILRNLAHEDRASLIALS